MNTILVPIDFSDTSRNSVAYAINIAESFQAKRIVLYHTYEIPVTGDPIVPMVQMMDYEALKKTNEEATRQFASEIQQTITSSSIDIEAYCELTDLNDGVNDACEKFGAELVITGITGAGKLEETVIGSNAVSIAKHTTVPVIIVPKDAIFKPIVNVLFACDFKSVIDTTPIESIRKMIDSSKAKLHVLHVNHTGEKYSPEMEHEIKMLDGLLHGLQPEYHFVDNEDFMQGINDFVTSNNVDIIVTIPKKHGFFENLFKKSHVKMLAFHSHVPLMVIHD